MRAFMHVGVTVVWLFWRVWGECVYKRVVPGWIFDMENSFYFFQVVFTSLAGVFLLYNLCINCHPSELLLLMRPTPIADWQGWFIKESLYERLCITDMRLYSMRLWLPSRVVPSLFIAYPVIIRKMVQEPKTAVYSYVLVLVLSVLSHVSGN